MNHSDRPTFIEADTELGEVKSITHIGRPAILESQSMAGNEPVQRIRAVFQGGDLLVDDATSTSPSMLVDWTDEDAFAASEREQGDVTSMLAKFQPLFTDALERGCAAKVEPHSIVLEEGITAKAVRPYRLDYHRRVALDAEVKTMFDKGIIVDSKSSWSAGVVMVPKSNGKWRLCIDFRELNKVTVADKYYPPRMEDLIDGFHGAVIFSTLDLLSGFWQVPLDEASRPLTAFSIPGGGHYEYTMMPFGLINAPSTFQRVMDRVLYEHRDFCRAYVDDVAIYSCSFDQHVQHMESVLRSIAEADLVINAAKCHLFKKRIRFLGHVVESGLVRPDPGKTEVIASWPDPADTNQVQTFLGFVNYYRKFIPAFASVAEPLYSLLRKNTPWKWDASQVSAMQTLKRLMTSEPILHMPDFNERFIVYTDASDFGLGAVLAQQVKGNERVICFASKSMNASQRNYSATDRECLSIQWALQHWRHYLIGRRFIVVTDHQALKWLLSSARDPHKRYARMILELQEFEFEIQHRPGNQHGNADGLSRLPSLVPIRSTVRMVLTRKRVARPRIDPEWALHPLAADLEGALEASRELVVNTEPNRSSPTDQSEVTLMDQRTESVDGIPPEQAAEEEADSVSRIDLANAQRQDIMLKALIDFIATDKMPTSEPLRRFVESQRSSFIVQDGSGLLCRVRSAQEAKDHPSMEPARPAIPQGLKALLIHEYHDDSIAGHSGQSATHNRVALKYWWPRMREEINEYVLSCEQCAKKKDPKNPSSVPLISPKPATRPFECISYDVLGPLPLTMKKNRYVLVGIDHYTKFTFAFPMPNQKSKTIALLLLERVFLEYGFPATVLSDRGANLNSELILELLGLMNIKKISTTGYHPQCNGLCERFNHTLVAMLTHCVNERQTDWDSYLAYAVFANRTTPQASTTQSPFFLLHGREAAFPIDVSLKTGPSVLPGTVATEVFMTEVLEKLTAANNVLAQRFEAGIRRQQAANQKLRRLVKFEVGDKVLAFTPRLSPKPGLSLTKKLAAFWQGPYEVVNVHHNNTYDLAKLDCKGRYVNVDPVTINAVRLKRYYDRSTSSIRLNEQSLINNTNNERLIARITASLLSNRWEPSNVAGSAFDWAEFDVSDEVVANINILA
jgi:hypothetical protein